MNQETWSAVDDYFSDRLLPVDPVTDAALADSDAAGLPQISVAPNQGKLLYLLARINGAKKILEIGTLGGYSTIWLGRALPEDGRLISLEFDPHHAEVATKNIARAGLANQVKVRVGRGVDSLPVIEQEGVGPFDFIFIDADKASYPEYWTWSLKLSRPGTVIICDNVVRGGAVVEPDESDLDLTGIRSVLELIGAESRVTATAIQTVGRKGYDGFAMAVVNG